MCRLGIRPISERHMGHVVQMDRSERGIRHLGIWGLGPSVARPGDWDYHIGAYSCWEHTTMRRRRRRRRVQRGGASVSRVRRILRRGPSWTDMIGSVASMFLGGPAPSFAKTGLVLGKILYKGIQDNVKHMRR